MWIQILCACVLYSMGSREFYDHIWAFVTSISHMGEIRDSDWSRPNLLRSDWLPTSVASITTNRPRPPFGGGAFLISSLAA